MLGYTLEDFRFDLRSSVAPWNHIGVGSGYSTTAPLERTVLGVRGVYSPPFAAGDLTLRVSLRANGNEISDAGSLGKGDCGLLLSGAVWQPDRISRTGTYHHMKDGQLLSLHVESELVPLYGRAGFLLVCSVLNRGAAPLSLEMRPELAPGQPNRVDLDLWDYGFPPQGTSAKPINEFCSGNDNVMIHMLDDGLQYERLLPGTSGTFTIAVVLNDSLDHLDRPLDLLQWREDTETVWRRRIESACERFPVLHTDNDELAIYYRRSFISGLICIWEHPEFALEPLPVVSGIEGAGICVYPWDIGGYCGQALSLMLGSRSIAELAALLADAGIARYSRFSPNGRGLNVPYSYNTFSYFYLVWSLHTHYGEGLRFYDNLRELLLADESRFQSFGELLDYGRQHNLLEMRGAGYEHVVVSPNAERAWCYDRLADLAEQLDQGGRAVSWREKAERIREAIRKELWDEEADWFLSLYPDGHSELIYSIQIFDALRMGVCSEGMRKAILSRLTDGDFLGPYGASSVSAKDELHYELNDPDWSGGGSYTGETPALAQTLWEIGEPDRAWDVLQRVLWLGKHLPYFPQEHYCDRPAVPAHKRANVIAGLTGAEAVIYGMFGLQAGLDGSLAANPHQSGSHRLSLLGFGFRGHSIDIHISNCHMEIVCDGEVIYAGKPNRVQIIEPRT